MAKCGIECSAVTALEELSQDYLKECFDYEEGVLRWRVRPVEHFRSERYWKAWNSKYAGEVAGSVGTCGYVMIRMTANGKGYYLKRSYLVWGLHGRKGDSALYIDHINGRPADDRIENLRQATAVENTRNQKMSRFNTSGYKGVRLKKDSGRWEAYINKDDKFKFIGLFDTKEEAIAARQKVEKEMFGEFSRSPEYL